MKIALGVSGGIAAYKSAEIVRLLQERGEWDHIVREFESGKPEAQST